MTALLRRSVQNPKTSILGLCKIVGAAVFLWHNRGSITPEQLMHPDGFLPALALVSGLNDVFFAADAKDEMKAREVGPDTTVIGERQ